MSNIFVHIVMRNHFSFFESLRAMQFGVMKDQSCSSVRDEPRKIVDDFSTFKSFFS
jgi:hypothetical protein